MSLENVRYDAFISYRHCELDSFVSENLHKKLETYKLPKSAVKKQNLKSGIERVFRDEAELPLSDNLSDPIMEALSNSEFLIVICTPRLSQSQWCKKEIETFIEKHDRQHVLLVLAEGEPEESFPEILMYEDVKVKDEKGNYITIRVDREPLAADCRGENNRQRLKAMDNSVIKLCAAIFNLNYDDLKQRHRERQIRRRLIALAAAMSVVTVFAVTCLIFTIKISSQSKIIQNKYAGSMAMASKELLSKGLRRDSIYAVRSVLPIRAEDGYNKDAYNALVRSVAPYEVEHSYFPDKSYKTPKDTRGFSVSEDLKYALNCCEGYASVIDLASDTEICRIKTEFSDNAVLNDMGVVCLDNDSKVKYIDPLTGEKTILADDGYDIYYVPEEKLTLVFTAGGIRGYRGLTEAYSLDYCEYPAGNRDGIMYDPDYEVEDVYITDNGRYAAFILSRFDDTCIGILDVTEGNLLKLTEYSSLNSTEDALSEFKIDSESDPDIESGFASTIDCIAVDKSGERLYVCHEYEDDYRNTAGNSILEVIDVSSGKLQSRELPGNGFYKILEDDNGILVISDRLAYVLDHDLEITSTISGYMDAVCYFACDGGYVILDALGHMFSDSVFSEVGKTYSLYGHSDNSMISSAIYTGTSEDTIFVKYRDSDRLAAYSPAKTYYDEISDVGDAEVFNAYPDNEIITDGLEGIEGISIFYAAKSDDGKYIAVSSNDGVLYIFDAGNGKKIKEIYNSDILLFHGAFPYLEAAGVYIIENRVFDEDFDIISELPEGEIRAKGRDLRSIVIESVYSMDTYYKITILPYDEIIKMADEILNDYKPDDGMCDKYQMLHGE